MFIGVRYLHLNLFLLILYIFYDQFLFAPTTLIPIAIFWVTSKCTFTIVSGAGMANRRSSNRLCERCACHVSQFGVLL
jgi:hypothetical protein